jgi:hypothetical protein
MSKTSENIPNLFPFVDALVDDLMTMSDDELIKEVREDGGDPDAIAMKLRAQIEARLLADSKAKLMNAREAMRAASLARPMSAVTGLSLDKKMGILKKFAANDGQLHQRLTMAARNGEGASEREIDDILRDLRDLGAIDNEGNAS